MNFRALPALLAVSFILASSAGANITPELGKQNHRAICDAMLQIEGKSLRNLDPEIEKAMIDSGWIEQISEADYSKAAGEMERLGLTSVKESQELRAQAGTIKDRIQYLERRTSSFWHYFGSFSWLGSGVVEKEKRELDQSRNTKQTLDQKISNLSSDVSRFEELQAQLAPFVASQGGYVRLTQTGQLNLDSLKHFKENFPEATLARVQLTLQSLKDALGLYSEFRKNNLYSSHDAPTLVAASVFMKKSVPEVVVLYQELRSLNLYSSRHAPPLAMTALQYGKSAKEVAAVYQSLRATNKLYSSDLAPALTSLVFKHSLQVSDVMKLYDEISELGKQSLYSSYHKPALMGLALDSGKPLKEVLDLYTAFRNTGALYSSDHAPTLATLSLKFGKSVEEVMKVYSDLRKQNLYSSSDAPALLLLMFATGMNMKDTVAIYQYVRKQNLYSSHHAPSLAFAGLGMASQQSSLFNNAVDLRPEDSSSSLVSTMSSAADDSMGFSLTWALTGDMMDNGSIDMSSGFITGGILGGMLD